MYPKLIRTQIDGKVYSSMMVFQKAKKASKIDRKIDGKYNVITFYDENDNIMAIQVSCDQGIILSSPDE